LVFVLKDTTLEVRRHPDCHVELVETSHGSAGDRSLNYRVPQHSVARATDSLQSHEMFRQAQHDTACTLTGVEALDCPLNA
jgi:hypothetical protein